MSKLQKFLTSFEKDGDGWLYYGDVDPKEAQAEYDALKARLAKYEALEVAAEGALRELCTVSVVIAEASFHNDDFPETVYVKDDVADELQKALEEVRK